MSKWELDFPAWVDKFNSNFQQHWVLMALLALSSLLIFFFSLFSFYWLLGRLPEDYFLLRFSKEGHYHPFPLWALILKNIAGIIILLGGIAMLALPGQGVLTLFMGILMINFPGKKKIEHWFILRSKVQKGLNYLRMRRGLTLFQFPTRDVLNE